MLDLELFTRHSRGLMFRHQIREAIQQEFIANFENILQIVDGYQKLDQDLDPDNQAQRFAIVYAQSWISSIYRWKHKKDAGFDHRLYELPQFVKFASVSDFQADYHCFIKRPQSWMNRFIDFVYSFFETALFQRYFDLDANKLCWMVIAENQQYQQIRLLIVLAGLHLYATEKEQVKA